VSKARKQERERKWEGEGEGSDKDVGRTLEKLSDDSKSILAAFVGSTSSCMGSFLDRITTVYGSSTCPQHRDSVVGSDARVKARAV
jgi:hypothetical protein